MLIKQADDKTKDIKTLRELLTHPAANADTKRKIDQEIRNISFGVKGEQDAAYEIDFHYGPSKNWAVIHDLRLEHDGRVAQIDHLLVNRFLDMWVCESKRFAEGIAINDQGECSMFWNGRPQGIASPHEQNAKHIVVIKALCDSRAVELPKRLGFFIKPDFRGLVVVSKNARVMRPKAKGWWDEGIVKADQVKQKIEKSFDSENNPLVMAKVIASETMEVFARGLADRHKPITFDWYARFGLPMGMILPVEDKKAVENGEAEAAKGHPQGDKPKSKLACTSCGVVVAYNVAKFCWFNKARFGGNVYCMDCQKIVPKPT
jgi:hypothetical protein